MALKGLPEDLASNSFDENNGWQQVEELSPSIFRDYIQKNIPDGVGDKTALERYKNDRLVSGCISTQHTNEVKKRYSILKEGQKDAISKAVRLKADGFCPTIRAGTASDKGSYQALRPIHPNQDRVITPREAARLQGFPDWFQFAPSKWHSFRQIGNSVSPILAAFVLEVIFKSIYVNKVK